jgi:F-type H+-transporting ATPase subunit b
VAEAEGRINAARAEAMGHVRGIAADTADAIVTRLTGQAAGAGEVERALAGVS